MKVFTLPVPPPSPWFVAGALVLSVSGCFQSTLPGLSSADDPRPRPPGQPIIDDPDAPQPRVSERGPFPVDRSYRAFERIGIDGRCIADDWNLVIDASGDVHAEIDEGSGLRQVDGGAAWTGDTFHIFFDAQPAFDLVPTDDVWNDYAVWHVVDDGGDLVGWSVELPPSEEAPVGLPSVRACAAFEQWSLHDVSGTNVSPSHAEVMDDVERETWYGDEGNFPLWIDIDDDGVFHFNDARLPLRDDGAVNGGAWGEVIAWDGTEGIARVRNSMGICSAADGLVTFWFVRDELHVMQEWYVVDLDDLDEDGDRLERHLRRTRSVLTEAACPRSLWR